MGEIQTSTYTFAYDLRRGQLTFRPADDRLGGIEAFSMGFEYHMAGRRKRFPDGVLFCGWEGAEVEQTQLLDGAWYAPAKQVIIRFPRAQDRLMVEYCFTLPDTGSMLLWKMTITNNGDAPVEIGQMNMLFSTAQAVDSWMTGEHIFLHSHGWQSWSWPGTYSADQKMKRSRVEFLESPMWYNPSTPRFNQAGNHSSDMYAVMGNRERRCGLLLGFLSQREQFGSIATDLNGKDGLAMWASGDRARLDPGRQMSTDQACLLAFSLDNPRWAYPYFDAVAREHNIRDIAPAPVGWCSWYHYFQKVTAENIRENLKVVAGIRDTLPLDLVQIDDGFERQVGDWFEFSPRFPDGLSSLVAEINDCGYTPGLWLAPFIVHPATELANHHPDWMLKNHLGFPVSSGYNWGAITQALDLTHPGAQHYVRDVIETAVNEWGFPYLKLDFLYAAALPGRRHDPTRTRAQTLRQGMEIIREAAGTHTTLLGCGAPVGSMIGLVEAMRIGSDVAETWAPNYGALTRLFVNEPNMPSVRNAIQNILTRAPMHNRWWVNDPDCLLVRPQSELTLAEIQTMATVTGMTGGAMLLSDDLTRVPEERLQIARALLPVLPVCADVLDVFDRSEPELLRLDLTGAVGEWHVLAWINRSDEAVTWVFEPQKFRLPAGDYWMRSFWDGQVGDSQHPLTMNVDPHGTSLLAVRRRQSDMVQYLGGDLHFSQGMEISEWKTGNAELDFSVNLGRKVDGVVDLAVPDAARGMLNRYDVVGEIMDKVFRIRVHSDK